MIVQRLRAIQNRFGYLPDEELRNLARLNPDIPLYRIEEVASFFPAFRLERDKPDYLEIKVCRDYTCHHRGAAALLADDGKLKKLAAELSTPGKKVKIEGVSCLGRCDRAPVCWVERQDGHDAHHDHAAHAPHAEEEHEHAWVYAVQSHKPFAELVRALASGVKRPEPDSDTTYEPNANVAYALPVVPARGANAIPPATPIAAALWDINPYGKDEKPPAYDAVRKVADWLKEQRNILPVPPRGSAEPIDDFVKKNHPHLAELRASTLLGMGGAGAPAYGKWLDVWSQSGSEKYIVCNGDESEPGTFKDRELLLRMPFLVVEGIVLAGLLTGATAGYIYIRHEYHEQIAACRAEIERAVKIGAVGNDVFGTGIPFPVEVFESPGGYICGEQSALLEAMEDRRSQPRNRPPELGTNGLRDKPTVVNNVETLAWAPYIVLRGGKSYAAGGWRVPGNPALGFAGRRLFSVSGDVNRPGVYEVPVGVPFRDLIENPEYCGGMLGGKALKAIAPSGPSGGLMPAKIPVDPKNREKWLAAADKLRSPADVAFMKWFLDTHLPLGATHLDLLALPLELNFFRNINGVLRFPVEPMLGAAIAVYAEGTDALAQAVNYSQFYRNESCGKCVPCRIGSEKLVQIGSALLTTRDAGQAHPIDSLTKKTPRDDVQDINKAMQQTVICGLGYVAPIPLATVLEYFPNDVAKKPT